MKKLVIEPSKCTGCRLCQTICALSHEPSVHVDLARVRIVKDDSMGFSTPLPCMQCETAACETVCPVGAIRRSAAGAVVVEKASCIGCQLCSLSCPLGAISMVDGVSDKCDLCGGEPSCVRFCASKALRYEDADKIALEKSHQVGDKLLSLLRATLLGEE